MPDMPGNAMSATHPAVPPQWPVEPWVSTVCSCGFRPDSCSFKIPRTVRVDGNSMHETTHLFVLTMLTVPAAKAETISFAGNLQTDANGVERACAANWTIVPNAGAGNKKGSMKNNLLTLAGSLALLAVLGKLYAALAIASGPSGSGSKCG